MNSETNQTTPSGSITLAPGGTGHTGHRVGERPMARAFSPQKLSGYATSILDWHGWTIRQPLNGVPTGRGDEETRQSTRRNGRSREQRFNELIAVHMDDLFRFAYWLSGDRSLAEDLVQETMIRAWKSLDRLKDTRAAKSWLLMIVRRENARHFGRRRPQASETPTEDLAAERSDYDTSTEAFVLRRALDRLTSEYREPLLMQVVYGYSQKEIADRLGISNAAAGTRLYRAREKMRALL
ncbi:MAG TPA: sigma-70 family RNA polymerase sigma factor [Gammaproteobacteria bacterium]|nr:sigma-70 family RNA polymerase sigma factor [Gammaproteobacteria bacterium]